MCNKTHYGTTVLMLMAIKSNNKTIRGHTRPCKANMAIQYHNVSFMWKICSLWAFISFILTYRNICCSLAHFLFHLEHFLFVMIFCSIWNIFVREHFLFHLENFLLMIPRHQEEQQQQEQQHEQQQQQHQEQQQQEKEQ